MVRGDLTEPFVFGVTECPDAVANRELDSAGPLNVSARVQEGELVSETVERRSQAVNRVSKNERTASKKVIEIGHVIDEEDIVSGIGLEFYPETWSISFDRERLPFILF